MPPHMRSQSQTKLFVGKYNKKQLLDIYDTMLQKLGDANLPMPDDSEKDYSWPVEERIRSSPYHKAMAEVADLLTTMAKRAWTTMSEVWEWMGADIVGEMTIC